MRRGEARKDHPAGLHDRKYAEKDRKKGRPLRPRAEAKAATAMGRDMTVSKRPFDIGQVIRRIRVAVRPFAKAAMFELSDDGFSSPFEQLVACIISIRTRDEVTVPTARKLFERARTPREVGGLTSREIDRLIRACTFHDRKAEQIRMIARRVVEEYEGELPCD